jgi:hypothetical protein
MNEQQTGTEMALGRYEAVWRNLGQSLVNVYLPVAATGTENNSWDGKIGVCVKGNVLSEYRRGESSAKAVTCI